MDGISGDDHPGGLPLACTLGADDGRSRLQRWQRLNGRATPTARLHGGELEIRYQPEVGVHEELTELAAAEQACCAFAQWRVTTVDDHPTLQVTGAPEALAPIAALFRAAIVWR